MSNRRSERRVTIRSEFDEQAMPVEDLLAAERLFARMAARLLLRRSEQPEPAGPRLHRRAGRALTPQEGGPAPSESERSDSSSGGQ